MKLILCSDGDRTAAWAHDTLSGLGCNDVELVTSGDLAKATRWSHRVKSDGSSVEILLEDGREIGLAPVEGVINRLSWPSRILIGQATAEDQDYAWSEMFAFYLSWLYALPGKVFNRATPQGLCGSLRTPGQWAMLAGQAGFLVEPLQDSEMGWTRPLREDRRLTSGVVVEGKPFGLPETAAIRAACRGLFERCGTSLLGVDVYEVEQGRWAFYGATPMPDLRAGGEPLMAEILKSWTSEVTA